MGRIHSLHTQLRKGKEIVRRATMTVLKNCCTSGNCEVEYVLRDLAKIAAVWFNVFYF